MLPYKNILTRELPEERAREDACEASSGVLESVVCCSSEATAVDRDLTVTQVNNYDQSQPEIGLDKRFYNNQRRL